MSERVRPAGLSYSNTGHQDGGYPYTVAFPRPRLTVSENAQRAGSVWNIDQTLEEAAIQRKLGLLTLRQAQLDAALGKSYDREDNLYRSFSVAKHVVNLELADDKKDVIPGMYQDIKTNLIERVRADTVPLRYNIVDGQLFVDSPSSSGESVSMMIQTGIKERLKHGTLEAEREQAELDGWNKLEAVMVDPKTKIGTTYTIFSPHSSITDEGEKGAYDKNFVNKFTLKEQDGERYIELIQRDIDLDAQGYRKAALSLDPHFFDEYDQAEKKPPFDAYVLARPVKGALPLAETEGMRMQLPFFEQNIYQDPLLQGMIGYYIEGVEEAAATQDTDWKDLCIRFNAILNRTDTLVELIENQKLLMPHDYQIFPLLKKPNPVAYGFMKQLVQEMGRRTPKSLGGGGCPTNKGYDVGGESPQGLYQGSVGQFGKEGGKCSTCNGSSVDNHYHCPGCTKSYADETAKDQADRTKKCGCGFEFGC